MSSLESLVLGGLAVLSLFWLLPGIKAAMARSKQSPADWQSVMLPVGMVVLFVLFLMAMV